MSNDGPHNIVDSLIYIGSKIWADEAGRNRAGVVVIQEQRAFAAREVMKVDARPGGYAATGGHGGSQPCESAISRSRAARPGCTVSIQERPGAGSRAPSVGTCAIVFRSAS